MPRSARQPRLHHSRRQGLTTPLVVGALLVAMCGLALILDRMWLEATRLELHTAAEAAALAGARELASDQRLRPDVDGQQLSDDATQSAVFASLANRAAGQPVQIAEADITFSDTAAASTSDAGLATDQASLPDLIRVQAHRTRFRGNPVALFISQLTRQPYGDAVGQAAAKIDAHVIGLRPVSGSAIPALPLAIWKLDPTGQRTDTWQAAIEQRKGRDDYGYDAATGSVTTGGDGLPELTLKSARRDGPVSVANLQLLDIGTHFDEPKLQRQIRTGWLPEDLTNWNGEFRLTTAAKSSDSLTLSGMPYLESGDRDAFDEVVGAARVALIYDSAAAAEHARVQQVQCTRMVAIRVLQVQDQADGSCQMIIQPAVLATRTALVDPAQSAEESTPSLAYVYRLELTR